MRASPTRAWPPSRCASGTRWAMVTVGVGARAGTIAVVPSIVAFNCRRVSRKSLAPINSLSALVADTAEHANGDAGQDTVALHQVHQAQQHQDPQRLRLAGGGPVCACACEPVCACVRIYVCGHVPVCSRRCVHLCICALVCQFGYILGAVFI